jgi:hypothetical protein
MRWIIIGMMGFLFIGCTPQPLDISSTYWKKQSGSPQKSFAGWPDWQKAPSKGVNFGKNKSWAGEYVSFVWDESGMYGRMFAFTFPAIRIYPEHKYYEESRLIHLMTTTPAYRSLGKVKAFLFEKEKYVEVPEKSFKTKDCGWVLKPGQCVTEFWISWDVLNPEGSPVKTTIRVKGRELILDPTVDGDNVKK